MINIKYKKIYDEFIKNYKEIHLDPWHEISETELEKLFNNLINNMEIDNEYSFKYFMDCIIKKLSGFSDAHTTYHKLKLLPINFRMFDNDVLINYPIELKGYKLVSINEVPTDIIIKELEETITYGTLGKRKYELEKALFNKYTMFGLPSLNNSEELIYTVENNGQKINKCFKKDEQYDSVFDYNEFLFGEPGTYRIIDNCLIYNHSSVQQKFKDQINESIGNLRNENLSNIDTIIVDIRGNFGGNSSLNKILIDFLKEQNDKSLICLTDYRVFSGGRYALRDLIALGATTIGEEISTPINCYGNSKWINIDEHNFSVSESYLSPFTFEGAKTKAEYKSFITEDKKIPYIFKPDILIEETKDDYINNKDTILNYALEYSKSKLNKHVK